MPTRIDFATLDLMDALDLAMLIEVEAYERYKMFAAQIGYSYAGDASTVFAGMAENEAKHGKEIAERRKALFGDAPINVTRDDIFDVEAPDVGAPRAGMSTLQAFEIALSSEQKAYDFYDDALPHVTDAEIKALFTELRDEEEEHVQMCKDAIAKLPKNADLELEQDEDELPAM